MHDSRALTNKTLTVDYGSQFNIANNHTKQRESLDCCPNDGTDFLAQGVSLKVLRHKQQSADRHIKDLLERYKN